MAESRWIRRFLAEAAFAAVIAGGLLLPASAASAAVTPQAVIGAEITVLVHRGLDGQSTSSQYQFGVDDDGDDDDFGDNDFGDNEPEVCRDTHGMTDEEKASWGCS